MSNDSSASSSPTPPAPADALPDPAIARRRDGVHADPSALGPALLAAVERVFADNQYFTDLDYPLLLKALYGCGPEFACGADGAPKLRFATDIVPFDPARRALYGPVKIADGKADYYFEPIVAEAGDADGAAEPPRRDVDEFIADMWSKGIRFGIDFAAVRTAIETGHAGMLTVARRLDAVAGQDAGVVEVSEDLHRSDAPRQLANGKLDLMSFQNRFPQIRQGVRLLKKAPRTAGTAGFELSGIAIEPAIPADLDLTSYSGLGTMVERTGDGEFLIAQQAGFLAVDAKTSQISINDKIISHDGVSAKTTGNLVLEGDYEEFGEVQEKRVIEGDSITIHADVFGDIVSRGGTIQLNHNLVGGSAHNKQGDIRVRGMASGAVLQASCGEVVLERAENCIVSGTRVTIEHAVNCEIIGDDVTVALAEGCAIAARHVAIESAGPRRQSEMLVYAMQPDCAQLDQVIGEIKARVAQFAALVAQQKAALEQLTSEAGVRKYMMLAARVRKQELVLTPEQVPQFQKMALAAGPALKAIGKASAEVKATEAGQQGGLELLARLERQRSESSGVATVSMRALQGEVQVRALPFDAAAASAYDLAPREIKARLRGNAGTVLFSGCDGAFEWSSEGADAPA